MDNDISVSSAEEQLKSFGNFIKQFDSNLDALLNKTGGTSCSNRLPKQPNHPIKLMYSTKYSENVPIWKLIESDSKLLNKTVLTFAYLCEEAHKLERECSRNQLKFLYLDEELCVFDDWSTESSSAREQSSDCLIKISKSTEFLCHTKFLVHQCIVVASNTLQQCGAVLELGKQAFINIQFSEILNSIAAVLVQLLTFDEILLNSNFRKYWSSYKKTIASAGHNLDKFDFCSDNEINGMLNVLNELEFLFSGTLFQTFLDSTFLLKNKIDSKALATLSGHLQDFIKNNLSVLEKLPMDLSEFHETQLFIKTNAICVVQHNFFGQMDPKSFKSLLEANNKHMGITLIGNVIWRPELFLKKHAETLLRHHEKYLHDVTRLRQVYLSNKIQNLQKDCTDYCAQISLWTLHIESALKSSCTDIKIENCKQMCRYFVQGTQFSGQLSYTIKALTNLHVLLRVTMSKATLIAICKLIAYLKMVQMVFQRNVVNIARIVQCLIQYLQYKALYIIASAKKKLSKEKLNDRNIDTLTVFKIAERCLSGPATSARLLITKLTQITTTALPPGQLEEISSILKRIDLLADFQETLDTLSDTSFVYWHQSLLPVYLKQVVDQKVDYHSFQNLFKAFNESGVCLDVNGLSDLKLTEGLKKSNYACFKSEIINTLCAQIEEFLRLEVHSNLQVNKPNPFEVGCTDHRELIQQEPMLINGAYVSMRDHVENYLSTMFYNLTTISLHDWKSYEEMRQMANYKLDLYPISDYLPTQTLEQGIDVLEIMRNIHIFVSKYLYNMNTQIFVEQSSPNKHLNTIGIKHIANSLRTHGSGIINTTVNFTYQFLKQKFYTFSQFLYDEQIKSRLLKERRHVAAHKQDPNYVYSYERADNFNKDIRKLGLAPDGQTYMDLFRKVITQIGNAMGYIRLIRSGSIHANYDASLYLPTFDDNLKFVELVEELKLSEHIKTAAQNLETNIKNLSNKLSDKTDFFKLLVEAFNPFFRHPNNIHLKTFYLIIPAVTLNYVEYILNAKDKVFKMERNEAVLFDDGFAMGLAYVLRLLNQHVEFNSLHWFASVAQRFKAENDKMCKMRQETERKTSKDDKLLNTLALTEKRIKAYKREFNLLYYSMNSAKIFFQ